MSGRSMISHKLLMKNKHPLKLLKKKRKKKASCKHFLSTPYAPCSVVTVPTIIYPVAPVIYPITSVFYPVSSVVYSVPPVSLSVVSVWSSIIVAWGSAVAWGFIVAGVMLAFPVFALEWLYMGLVSV